MKLGVFSISLSVKDIHASHAFYEKLGFEVFGGALDQNYLIMKSGHTLVGLFQGMFEGNLLTFNPGWDTDAQLLESFDDVRDIHRQLQAQGINTEQESLDGASGPGSFVVIDPDGNPILIDQHV
jgi:catechol 2,3-dioxygenase-like lactoylglutathione lyase family enzyme